MNKNGLRGNQINWNQVFYFSRIAACGSIKDAAEELGLTPSTLSEHLTQLEADLKVQLFYRQHRKLILTPQGSRLFQHAKQMFEAGQRLIDVVSPIPLGCYPVSVGSAAGFCSHEVQRLLRNYLGHFGPLNLKLLHISHSQVEEGLASAQYDFGFSAKLSQRKDVIQQLLVTSPIRFYASSKFWHRSFHDLLKELPLLVYDSDSGLTQMIDELLAELEANPASVLTTDSLGFLEAYCEEGLGVGVFSEYFVKSHASKLKALRVPTAVPKLSARLYVMWTKEGENSEAVKRLKELLIKKPAGMAPHPPLKGRANQGREARAFSKGRVSLIGVKNSCG